MSNPDEIEDSSAPLIEHLAELRNRLIHSVVAFIIGMVICFHRRNADLQLSSPRRCVRYLAERGSGLRPDLHQPAGRLFCRHQGLACWAVSFWRFPISPTRCGAS